MSKRAFTAAPDWLRCTASVRLRDGSRAQCMRYQSEGYRGNVTPGVSGLCTQHADLLLAGKLDVNEFGAPRLKGR
jgi:hypothetical protein